MSDKPFNVLFLCTGNSARSILAESALRKNGGDRFRAFSAGIRPGTELNPFALDVLRRNGHDVAGLRSKHISEFQQPGAPEMDFVFTVCDTAAAEECPPWPGQPITAHWGIEDPSNVEGSEIERERAFVTALRYLRNRINVLLSLPVASLDQMTLAQRVRQIGALEGASRRRPEVAWAWASAQALAAGRVRVGGLVRAWASARVSVSARAQERSTNPAGAEAAGRRICSRSPALSASPSRSSSPSVSGQTSGRSGPSAGSSGRRTRRSPPIRRV